MVVLRVSRWRSLAPAWPLIMVLAAGGGCSDAKPVFAVSGQVTFEGKPVTRGVVHFASNAGFGASAPIGPGGTYSVSRSHLGKGIPQGTYRVIVTPPAVEFNESGPLITADGRSASIEAAPEQPDIPRKYREFATSGLKCTVDETSPHFDIRMAP